MNRPPQKNSILNLGWKRVAIRGIAVFMVAALAIPIPAASMFAQDTDLQADDKPVAELKSTADNDAQKASKKLLDVEKLNARYEQLQARIEKNREQDDRDDDLELKRELNGLGEIYFLYGSCYEEGVDGVEKNLATALECYRKAADLGIHLALINMGKCYAEEQNMQKAVECYEKAAKLGETSAMVQLGKCYMEGQGVEKNPETAVAFYRDAANLGNSGAMYDLGRCYVTGEGVYKDYVEAIKWFKKSARSGQHPEAREDAYHLFKKTTNSTMLAVCLLLFLCFFSSASSMLIPRLMARFVDFSLLYCIIDFAVGRFAPFVTASIWNYLYFLFFLLPFLFLFDGLIWSLIWGDKSLGKWLFCIKLNDKRMFCYLERNLRIYVGTILLGIPILNLIPIINQIKRVSRLKPTIYDEVLGTDVVYDTECDMIISTVRFIFGVVLYAILNYFVIKSSMGQYCAFVWNFLQDSVFDFIMK